MSDISVITLEESKRLIHLEVVIKKGLDTFFEVGAAFAEVRDSRLYRSDYGTFEEYCRQKWNMSKRHCDRLIASAEVVSDLGPTGPKSERQARPLTTLRRPSERAAAWARAGEIAGEAGADEVTTKHIEQAVAEVKSLVEDEQAKKRGSDPAEFDFDSFMDQVGALLEKKVEECPEQLREEVGERVRIFGMAIVLCARNRARKKGLPD